ncbi:30S ribosomal protein S6 [Chloroflexota bacterium]
MPDEVNELNDYEMMVIIRPEIDTEKMDASIDSVNRLIANKAGVVSEVERRGKRKLAYPIRRFVEGNYVLTRFKLKPSAVKDLEKELLISEDVLRHLLIKLGG